MNMGPAPLLPIEKPQSLRSKLETGRTILAGGNGDALIIFANNLDGRIASYNLAIGRAGMTPEAAQLLAEAREKIIKLIAVYNECHRKGLPLHCDGCKVPTDVAPFRYIDLIFTSLNVRFMNISYAVAGACLTPKP